MPKKIELTPAQLRRARWHLKLLNEPGATIGVGTIVGAWLYQEGFVTIAKFGRYGITPKGIDFLLGRAVPARRLGELNGTQMELKSLPIPKKQGELFDFERG